MHGIVDVVRRRRTGKARGTQTVCDLVRKKSRPLRERKIGGSMELGWNLAKRFKESNCAKYDAPLAVT
jgi:hypothetical protein